MIEYKMRNEKTKRKRTQFFTDFTERDGEMEIFFFFFVLSMR